jgi:hypothetical protein
MKEKKADREFYIFKSIIDCKVYTMNNTIDKSLTEKNIVDHPKLLFEKENEKHTFKNYDRTTAKKGILIIIFKTKYMFNDIWPIYNVLKIFK